MTPDAAANDLMWTQSQWREKAEAWIRHALSTLGLVLAGEIEQPHARPWSTVLRVPTDAGSLFFKACAPGFEAEPALTDHLHHRRPQNIPAVLAMDAGKGWMLSEDAGVPLRSVIQTEDELHRWDAAIRACARLQLALIGEDEALLAMGVTDRRLHTLPQLYEDLVRQAAIFVDARADFDQAAYDRVASLQARVDSMCQQLAGYGIPDSIDHGDFHDANVFVKDDRTLLMDWGDAVLTHPFASLLIPPRNIEWRFAGLEERSERARLSKIYLPFWRHYGETEDLVEAMDIAVKLAMFGRAATWLEVALISEDPLNSSDAPAVPGWLMEFADAIEEGNEKGAT